MIYQFKSLRRPAARNSSDKIRAAKADFPLRGPSAPLPGVVAVVGCDGSGKTRLARDLAASLRRTRPAERRYMGLISGETGDRIRNLPVMGVALERYLAAKVRRAQDMKKTLPGTPTAVVMYLFSLWRVLQLRRMRKRAESGVLIIAERYPQAEIAGFHYDGPGLSTDRARNGFVRGLAIREQRLYDRMADRPPSLVIRLVIDADTAHARKSDHPLAELRDKTAALPLLKYNDATIFEIDATRPYDEVLASALDAIEREIPALRYAWR